MTFVRCHAPRTIPETNSNPDKPVTLFIDAEEAWFWYMRCQKARWEGARFDGGVSISERPCLSDDIYRAVMSLYRSQKINKAHLRTLATYGISETPPDPAKFEEERDCRLWNEALDRLSAILMQKNVIDYEG